MEITLRSGLSRFKEENLEVEHPFQAEDAAMLV